MAILRSNKIELGMTVFHSDIYNGESNLKVIILEELLI